MRRGPEPPARGRRARGLAARRARPARPAPARRAAARRLLVFFILPVLWLLLAATKTDPQLVRDNPLAFGSWHALRHNWDALTSFQGDTILLWLRNSALYAFSP